MKNTIFTGAAIAIITPMNADGSINYDELGRIIDDQINNGTDAIVICGTTGDSATMTDDEHRDCIKFAVKHVAEFLLSQVQAATIHAMQLSFQRKQKQQAQMLFSTLLLIIIRQHRRGLSLISQQLQTL